MPSTQLHSLFITKMRTKLTLILLIGIVLIGHTCSASKWQHRESCSKKLQEVKLSTCEKHVMENIRDDNDDKENVLRYIMKGGKQAEEEEEEEDVQKCCSEMKEVRSSKCQCRALQKIMENQGEKLDDNQKKQLQTELMKLAMSCGFGPMIDCDLRFHDQ